MNTIDTTPNPSRYTLPEVSSSNSSSRATVSAGLYGGVSDRAERVKIVGKNAVTHLAIQAVQLLMRALKSFAPMERN